MFSLDVKVIFTSFLTIMAAVHVAYAVSAQATYTDPYGATYTKCNIDETANPMFASIPDGAAYCGQTLTVTNAATGKFVNVIVADQCTGCGIDLGRQAFLALGLGDGPLQTVTYTVGGSSGGTTVSADGETTSPWQ